MKTIRNTTNVPIAVPLPGGRKLHLGPGKSGEISAHAAEHPPLTALVTSGALELGDGVHRPAGHSSGGQAPAANPEGHHPANKGGRRGDR